MRATPTIKEMTDRGIIKFVFFKSVPYATRLYICVTLFLIGVTWQLVTTDLFPGLIFLVLTIPFVFVRGYDNYGSLKCLDFSERWEAVGFEKLDEVLEFAKKVRKWDSDWLDISCGKGALLFLSSTLFVAYLGFFVISQVGNILFWDYVVLILPYWFSGMRFSDEKSNIVLKIRNMKNLCNYFQEIKKEGEELRPMFKLNFVNEGREKSYPTDVKIMVNFKNKPADFLGVQGQVCINFVRGTPYPYFYCVILAKKGFNLRRFEKELERPEKVVSEYKSEKDVELIVIRQRTTRKSGYHTNEKVQRTILLCTVENVRKILNL